eukprot:4651567-Prymnesium_polylepis.1
MGQSAKTPRQRRRLIADGRLRAYPDPWGWQVKRSPGSDLHPPFRFVPQSRLKYPRPELMG